MKPIELKLTQKELQLLLSKLVQSTSDENLENPNLLVSKLYNKLYDTLKENKSKKTELNNDAIQVLLNSSNTLSDEYGFNIYDFKLINQWRARQNQLINEVCCFLEKCKEHNEG